MTHFLSYCFQVDWFIYDSKSPRPNPKLEKFVLCSYVMLNIDTPK